LRLATQGVVFPGGELGVKAKDVPFAATWLNKEAMFLNSAKPQCLLSVGKTVKKMHILLAAMDPGEKGTDVFRGTVVNEDGKTIPLVWKSGVNLASSIGERTPLTPDGDKFFHSAEVLKGSVLQKAGTNQWVPGRLFTTTWENDNEWYPVKEVKFELLNKNAQVMIIAVTVE
jgi:hypothetical protein